MTIQERSDINKKIETELAVFHMEDGIIIGKYKHVVITLEGAVELVEARKKVSGYQSAPILIDGREVKQITKGARDYFGSNKGSELLEAAAIYVNSPLTTFLANFVIKISFKKSPIPIKMFTDREKAIRWLKPYVSERINDDHTI